jgi:hypothetical protein
LAQLRQGGVGLVAELLAELVQGVAGHLERLPAAVRFGRDRAGLAAAAQQGADPAGGDVETPCQRLLRLPAFIRRAHDALP